MNWDESLLNLPRSGGRIPFRPTTRGLHPQHRSRSRGLGRGRGDERGAMSMESLNISNNWWQKSANQKRRKQNFDGRKGWRQSLCDQDGWIQRPFGSRDGRDDDRGHEQDDGVQGRRLISGNQIGMNRSYGGRGGRATFLPRGGSRQTEGSSGNPGDKGNESDFRSSRNKRRERPMGNKELEKLATLQPDLVIFELLSEESGFPLLIEEGSFTPYKMDLIVKALARATTTQSNRDTMHELLNKTCTEDFVAELMDYILTLKREYPQKGPVFFAEVHSLLDTFANAMPNIASNRLVNLVDGCHTALTTMEADEFVEDSLVNKYKVLLEFLTEAKKRWAREEKMDGQARRRRETEMDNMEPPDDFRELSVLPTRMAIKDTNRPFLRKNIVSGRYADGHHYLDVQFRLLREDFLRPLRVGISQFRSNTQSRIMDVRIYRNVTYVDCRVKHRRIFHEIKLGSMKMTKLENSKRLMYGNLVCISNDNFSTMVLGSVADRTPEGLQKGIIGVEFESNFSDFDMSGQFTMVESRAYFVAYKHILQVLKDMPENIPMEKYVVHVSPEVDLPQYLGQGEAYDLRVTKSSTLIRRSEAALRLYRQRKGEEQAVDEEDQEEDMDASPELRHLQAVQVIRALPYWSSAAELGLDSSQQRALCSALTRELAIIQGPPGTGKTFIGLKIVQTLLHNSQVWKIKENPTPILVVCFTNHALDQFLEGMTTFTDSIVRVGSRTQSEKIRRFQINKLVQDVVSYQSLPQNVHDTKIDISKELGSLEREIHRCQEVDHECSAARGIFYLDEFAGNIIPGHILQQLQEIPYIKKIAHWLTENYQAQGTPGLMQQQQPGAKKKKKVSDSDDEVFKDAEFIETEQRERKLDDDFEESVVNWVNVVQYEVTMEELERTLEILSHRAEEGDVDAFLNHVIISGELQAIMIGLDIPVNGQDMEALENNPQLNIWHLEPRVRWQLYNHWVAKLQRGMKAAWNALSEELQKKMKTYEGIRNAEYLYTMRKAAIVGMTTTGAAQYNSILRDLAPVIVVIEEAAEILEAHVVASLTAGCQHLIMIGLVTRKLGPVSYLIQRQNGVLVRRHLDHVWQRTATPANEPLDDEDDGDAVHFPELQASHPRDDISSITIPLPRDVPNETPQA